MKTYRLTAVIWEEGNKYVSKCPELGVASYGFTPEKARQALEEAVALYLKNAEKLGILRDLKTTLNSKQRYTTNLKVVIS